MRPDPHTLAGAYALDAIDDDLERRRFEQHLAECAECAHELATFAETAARLGQAMAVEPPPGLRANVMAAIGQVRQLPPAVASPGARRRRIGWAPWLAAVAAVAAVVLAVVAVRAQDQVERLEAANRQVAAALAAPDARVATAAAERGGRGTVVISREEGRLVFVAEGLPALPEDRTYQVWQIAPGRIRSAGLVGAEAATMVLAPAPGVSSVGVTVEPAGGSPQPTGTPLLLVEVPAT
ncbi:anti-sigma factor [Thermoactinospora rubra]|uniref:anti-sigma factor n=1 Tax=Thermoactinospora rubra TaxID=1088767 RepID=UPI000A1086F2|nr:anti-sigma factor [Thermoactinospora rubra]